jgi:hypothetical protein
MLMYFCAARKSALAGVPPAGWHAVLRDPTAVPAQADFSLHLSPIDLDILVEEVCAALGAPVTTLTDSLVERVAGDNESWGVEVVAPQLVGLLARAPPETAEPLAALWMEAVAREHGEASPGASADAARAVSELVNVCGVALRLGLPVLHAWCL